MVRESSEEVRFPLCKELAPVFLLSQWQEKEDELHKENEFVCNVNPKGDTIEVHIVADQYTIDDIAREVKVFVELAANDLRL